MNLGWFDGITISNLKKIKDLKCNTIMPYMNEDKEEYKIKEYLDEAKKLDIKISFRIPSTVASDLFKLEKMINTYKDYENILEWYMYDEPEWKLWIPTKKIIKDMYNKINELDPNKSRLKALVLMFPFLAFRYKSIMSSYWVDWYPIRNRTKEFSAFHCNRFIKKIKRIGKQAIKFKLPLTLVLQGYGTKDNGEVQFGRRLPTIKEFKYMLYSALLANPIKILFWTFYRANSNWLENVFRPIISEFKNIFTDDSSILDSNLVLEENNCFETIYVENNNSQYIIAIHKKNCKEKKILQLKENYLFEESNCTKLGIPVTPYSVTIHKIYKGNL